MNYTSMILIMFVSGLLSSMYLWADKLSDIRISINDIYMIFLMTAWMCFFMALLHKDTKIILISAATLAAVYYAIRNQLFVTANQYFKGMIPHHSMAILTSKRLLENHPRLTNDEQQFVKNIITTQENEIRWMKLRE
jgi:Domain of unknown function (DUF305)